MAQDGKPVGAEGPALDDADPDILAIRALMSKQNIVIERKPVDATIGKPLCDTPAPAQGSASPHAPQEMKAAISKVIENAEQDAPTDTRPRRENHRNASEAQAAGGHGQAPQKARFTRVLSLFGTFAWQVLRHPQTPRVILVVLLFTALVLRPVVVIGLALLLILTAAVIYFSVGPEAVDGFILRRFEALKTRAPERADELRGRAIRIISVLNRLIDRLPERWTAGLYLPDLDQPIDPPERMQDDPFERLAPVAGGQQVIRKASRKSERVLPPDPPDPRERKASPGAGGRRPPRRIRP